jgi:Glucose-6-phosphate isomerase
MESYGVSTDSYGVSIYYPPGTMIWGSTGTYALPAFFPLFHPGTSLIPTDFIGFWQSLYPPHVHPDPLIAHFIAQTEALMVGVHQNELLNEKVPYILLPYRVFKGNQPSTTILIEKLTPYHMGALIAAYEHKIFTPGVLWNIFSFDPWGVELGKKLATKLLKIITTEANIHDSPSTKNLINFYKIRLR